MNHDGGAPRHGHRSPAEIAEDEVLAVLRGDACDVPEYDAVTPARARRGMLNPERLLPVRNADRLRFDVERSVSRPDWFTSNETQRENGEGR